MEVAVAAVHDRAVLQEIVDLVDLGRQGEVTPFTKPPKTHRSQLRVSVRRSL